MLFAYHSPEQNLNFFELELKKKNRNENIKSEQHSFGSQIAKWLQNSFQC